MIGLLAISVMFALKVTSVIVGSLVALYFLLCVCLEKWGLEFLIFLIEGGKLILILAAIFAIVFVCVLGVGALF